ncbi:DUF2812 domain-containing protein [Bacillus sp. RO2]|uniref:DUF2812 domain-containing protein n=1 Tax=Bacillus sp. RO2 TaxID=2723913 RepID=UPI00145D7A72|nr:DUF2812 domain-containing protein [Bacillus sp. RO2]NMH73043.1 DUF2812 domain-containing protein [Bacillus sp. RO2]
MKTKKKILWLDLWQIAEQEAWLTGMAAKGWELTKMTKLTAHFKKAAPQTITYKTDIFKEPISQNLERLEQYEQAGWKYVASRGHLHFFRNNSNSSEKELQPDPIKQAESLKLLRSSLRTRSYLIPLLTLIGIALAVFMLTLDPIRNYLDDEFLFPGMQILIFFGLNLMLLKGLIHLNKLIKTLQSNKGIQPTSDFRKKYWQKKIIGLSLITFFAVVFLYKVSTSGYTPLEKSIPPIPKEDLPVVQIGDFTKSYEPYSYEESISRENFYSVNSSILVPEQNELNQLVEVEVEQWEDGSGPYRPSLTSRQYIVRNDFLAERLFQHLIDREEELHRGDATLLNTTAFDELYVLENSILSRKGHIIYYVTYFGKEPIEKIIHAMEQKITE